MKSRHGLKPKNERMSAKMKKMKYLLLVLLLLLLTAVCLSAGAEEAENLTGDLALQTSSNKNKIKNITDEKYATYWSSDRQMQPWVTVSSEKPMYGLYLCFFALPDSYVIQKPSGDSWVTVAEGDSRFCHAWVELEGEKNIRILSTVEKKSVLGFNEIFAFGQGETPDWVQKWEPTEEKADILFMATHPDDDVLFLGSPIVWYGTVQKKRVVVSYLTYVKPERRSEALNGLWAMGIRHYPVFGGFSDHFENGKTTAAKVKAAYAYAHGGREGVWEWVTGLYRRYRPEVVVTHDLDGEYGHAQHMMMADAAVQCFAKAADAALYPDSAEKYGPWQVKKLYIHLWGDEAEQTSFDWDQPLEALGGLTANEYSSNAYAMHVSQAKTGWKYNGKRVKFSVEEYGVKRYPNNRFGLYSTTVGPDETGTDFLEHIPEAEGLTAGAAESEETAVEPAAETEETKKTAGEPAEEAQTPEDPQENEAGTGGEETAAEETEEEAAGTAGETENAAAAEPEPAAGKTEATAFADVTAPEWADVSLNDRGFLDEGEYVFADDEAGHYFYASPTLRVKLERRFAQLDKKHPLYYFVAHVWCDTAAGELPTTVFVDPEKPKSVKDFSRNIAMNYKAVLGMTTDYYIYRIKQTYPTGIEVRNGTILFDEPRKLQPTMPTYETLALYSDGHAESWTGPDKSAEDYVREGATQVYTFGPCLVKDGELTEYVREKANTSYNPRMALGVAENGHYIVIMCEGRIARSKGVQMPYLAQLMLDEGCTLAVNLDGGQSAVLTFMGHQMNIGLKSDPNGREQADLLIFGTSEQVGSFEMLDQFKSKKK